MGNKREFMGTLKLREEKHGKSKSHLKLALFSS